jgi:hypothetical protein
LAKVIPTELLSKKYGRFAHCFTQIFAPSMELSFFDRIDITIDFDLKLFTIYIINEASSLILETFFATMSDS